MAWDTTNDAVDLWHGCLETHARNIQAKGVIIPPRTELDFGRGFYLTTLRHQAEKWARRRYKEQKSLTTLSPPAVVRFRVPWCQVSDLSSLFFVVAQRSSDRYWDLVWHCRTSAAAVPNTHIDPPTEWYDVVKGPVAAKWRRSVAIPQSDQISFHTTKSVAILNALKNGGNLADFEVRVLRP
jgi:hypothetical protein